MNRVYAYLRASTSDQDANRAKSQLEEFAFTHDLKISSYFTENESGALLARPELFRLLDIAEDGDILLVEQVDRISRLNNEDWTLLKKLILDKGINVVSLDLPTSHQFVKQSDEFTKRMLQAINSMMLDMLAAISRKDYEDRRKRQAQGVQKAKKLGKYKGRPVNKDLHSKIEELLLDNKSYSSIQRLLGCSRHTISKVKKNINR
ncbi:MAG: recombinase family protein [bacterium]|nr:recombinase family protein [bacterium]